MALIVNTNVASLNAQRNLSATQLGMSRVLSHLSSGLRITSASDDAAGLAISESLKAQIRSTAQAERNSNDGISISQVAEGALEQVGNLLTRMHELAVESANGTLDTNSHNYLNNEFDSLRKEIDRIAAVTQFNNKNLLDGTLSGGVTMQVGINNSVNDVITLAISNIQSVNIGSGGSSTQFLGAAAIDTQTNSQTALATLDQALTQISASRAGLGALQNRLQVTIANLSTANENLSAANSRIRDVDVASETAALTRFQILSQAGIAVLAQANQLPSAALALLKG